MKDSVQIKAELFAGQHDALIEFYGRYNRLFVNKLLLKLCEGVMPEYEPTLALFHTHDSGTSEPTRKVAIRIEKEKYPLVWDFYKDLPYGSRTMVIVNLMNHYVTLAEADPRIMETTYWSQRPTLPGSTAAEPAARLVGDVAVIGAQSRGVTEKEQEPNLNRTNAAVVQSSSVEVAEEVMPLDPLSVVDTGL